VLELVLVLIVVGASIGFAHSDLTSRIETTENRITQMQNDIEKFKPQLDAVAGFRAKKAELQKKIDVIAGLDRARKGPVRIMDELARTRPSGCGSTACRPRARRSSSRARASTTSWSRCSWVARRLAVLLERRPEQHRARQRSRRPQGREVQDPGDDAAQPQAGRAAAGRAGGPARSRAAAQNEARRGRDGSITGSPESLDQIAKLSRGARMGILPAIAVLIGAATTSGTTRPSTSG
jgi:hypothetical protein